MKGSQVLGIILAIALMIFGVVFPTPEKQIRVYGYYDNCSWNDSWGEEYVGGDAYNYQMEASLKAGYMGGVLAMKSITFVGGVLLFFLTLFSRMKCAAIEEQTRKLSKCADEQLAVLQALSNTCDQHFSPNEENNVEEETV